MNRRLLLASAFLAVFWTTFMYVWEQPEGYSGKVALIAAGLFVGMIWYVAMKWFTRRMTARW
jgi:hypothetical protein